MPEAAALAPGSGALDRGAHRFRLRVYYEDTDTTGFVYHARYLAFAERARTEFLRVLGIGQEEMRRAEGVFFAVRRCAVEYRAPARLDDVLEVRTEPRAALGARVEAAQTVHPVDAGGAAGDWLARLDLQLACVNREGRPVRLPARARAAFERLAAGGAGRGLEARWTRP